MKKSLAIIMIFALGMIEANLWKSNFASGQASAPSTRRSEPESPLFVPIRPESQNARRSTNEIMFPFINKDGTWGIFDESRNILVVGAERVMIPGKAGEVMVSRIRGGGEIMMPIWRNSAIRVDEKGIRRIIYLQNANAKDLFQLLNRNDAEVERLFGESAPAAR